MVHRRNTPTFSDDYKEPTIRVILRWKEGRAGYTLIHYVQTQLAEVTVYNKQEYDDLVNGIFQAINNVI